MSDSGRAPSPEAERSAPLIEWVVPQQASPRSRASWSATVAAVWPTHRAILLGCIGAAVLITALVVWLRFWATGLIADVTASPLCQGVPRLDNPDCSNALSDARYGRIEPKQSFLQMAAAVVTAGAGVVLGVSAFARDFEQRTQVLLLTQGISRNRWWVARSVLAVLPWSLTTAAVGAIFAWALESIRLYSAPMETDQFYLSALGLFVVGTVSVCLGVTVGVLLRTTLGAVLLAGLLTAVAIGGAEVARPYLVPTDRIVSEATGGPFYGFDQSDVWLQRAGYLDASGRETVETAVCVDLWSTLGDNATEAEYIDVNQQCLRRSGIVASYVDVIPASRFPLLRTLWAGGLLAVSALVLVVGFHRVRRRVL